MVLKFDSVIPACRELLRVKKIKDEMFYEKRNEHLFFLVFIYLPF